MCLENQCCTMYHTLDTTARIVDVLKHELSFLAGARRFFLVIERRKNGHFRSVFFWTRRPKKYFSSWFSKRGRICFRIRHFYSCKFNRYRERAFRKSSFCSLFLLTILALHLPWLRKLFTNPMSYLDFFKNHDNSKESFLHRLKSIKPRFEPCIYR